MVINQIKRQYEIKQSARRHVKEKLRQRAALGVAPGPSTSECIACLPLACAACPRMLLLRFLHSPGRLTQSQTKAVAPDLPVRKRFGEDVGRHVVVYCPTDDMTAPFAMTSRMKWKRMSMCLVRA